MSAESAATAAWQFWIDVGGTFTDCLARTPTGVLLRHKCLSSGVTKGTIGTGATASLIQDDARRRDPAGFWSGAQLRLMDRSGATIATARVADFAGGNGPLLLEPELAVLPRAGMPYELLPDEEAPVQAIRYLLELPAAAVLPAVVVRLGTTRGTNALLTRTGAKTAFVTTAGFGDVLEIGYQNRLNLFDLDIRKPPAVCQTTLEIAERVAADGSVLKQLDADAAVAGFRELRAAGVESLAICLLHADRYPAHEELLERLARSTGFKDISLSSRVAPLIKIVSRGDTTAVDAYLNPVLSSYLAQLEKSFGQSAGSEFRVLTSAGGLVNAGSFRGKDSILSGPAGGVVGVARVAESVGFQHAIGFDMGGTSSDVSRYDGRFELEYETEKAGVRIVAPMMAIETVAAGGGSICRFDGVRLAVGPLSAGADPGPACYGRGGPLTVTDMNLFLGRILRNDFPFRLDRETVDGQLQAMCQEIAATTTKMSPAELAEGFLAIANRNMAQAIRSVSIAKGYDPASYVLVAFGGAAPQHACAVAEQLRIGQIVCHPDAGILSAYGVGMADVVRHGVAGIYQDYADLSAADLDQRLAALAAEAREAVVAEGVPAAQVAVSELLDIRYRGTEAAITVPRPSDADFARAFAAVHQQRYGYVHDDRPLEVVAARVEACGRSDARIARSERVSTTRSAEPEARSRLFFAGEHREAGVYRRAQLVAGDTIRGPAIVLDGTSTTVVDPGWQGQLLSGRELLLTREPAAASPGEAALLSARRDLLPVAAGGDSSSNVDPILLEIFNSHFVGIAEQMGITLRNTASSVNVKERLDYSCALFTASGDLVVNAPHIPVHLGAMGETVKQVLLDHPDLAPGDVLVSNDPYHGGSHLPDITVITPVHDRATRSIRFFAANRAHHAEIGGIAPGSMSPRSRSLADEGVLIRSYKVIERGKHRFDGLRRLFLEAPHPTRDVEMNLADISAQIAANQQGTRDLERVIDTYGWSAVAGHMEYIQQAAERQVRLALEQLNDGCHRFVDHLDDGSPIAVSITISGDRARFDFSGTGPVLEGNLNANRAIVTAAVMYCLRCLVRSPLPLNQGVLAPVEIFVPESLLNPPRAERAADCPAMAGGNVETSQRVVDVILGALGSAAASQGTMNNVLFGNRNCSYYETICGGAGATSTANGAAAVQTHMTNTRITDPEIVEQRFPVRINQFSVRRGSGGDGRHVGGDGIVRKIEFLEPFDLTLLTQRRGPYPPYGLAGGQPGALGVNQLRHADGTVERLPATAQLVVQAGDELTIMTPGGGGYGQG